MREGRSNESRACSRLTRSDAKNNNALGEMQERRHDGTRIPEHLNGVQDRDLDRVATVLVTIALRLVERTERR